MWELSVQLAQAGVKFLPY
uniref:Uncharacterized protein n=1 Tax=Anguilla anguilla TaxID=7936 RepID=A0A0E9SF81_ANGAN